MMVINFWNIKDEYDPEMEYEMGEGEEYDYEGYEGYGEEYGEEEIDFDNIDPRMYGMLNLNKLSS